MRRTQFVVRYRTVLVIVAALAALGLALALVSAQPGPQEGQQQGQERGGRDMGLMRMMGGMAPPAIAIAGDAVFVVSGNMIYKFDAGTLELLAQAELPRPERPRREGGEGAQ